MKVEKFKVLLYLKKSGTDKSGKAPIMGRITVNRTMAQFGCSPDGNASVLPSSFSSNSARRTWQTLPSWSISTNWHGWQRNTVWKLKSRERPIVRPEQSVSTMPWVLREPTISPRSWTSGGCRPTGWPRPAKVAFPITPPRKPTDIQGWNCSSLNQREISELPVGPCWICLRSEARLQVKLNERSSEKDSSRFCVVIWMSLPISTNCDRRNSGYVFS